MVYINALWNAMLFVHQQQENLPSTGFSVSWEDQVSHNLDIGLLR